MMDIFYFVKAIILPFLEEKQKEFHIVRISHSVICTLLPRRSICHIYTADIHLSLWLSPCLHHKWGFPCRNSVLTARTFHRRQISLLMSVCGYDFLLPKTTPAVTNQFLTIGIWQYPIHLLRLIAEAFSFYCTVLSRYCPNLKKKLL